MTEPTPTQPDEPGLRFDPATGSVVMPADWSPRPDDIPADRLAAILTNAVNVADGIRLGYRAGRALSVGRCGETPKSLFDGAAPVTCALPAGHAGWHLSDGGTEWGMPAETDRLVVAVLDRAIVWRQDLAGNVLDLSAEESALVAAVDAMLAARHTLRAPDGEGQESGALVRHGAERAGSVPQPTPDGAEGSEGPRTSTPALALAALIGDDQARAGILAGCEAVRAAMSDRSDLLHPGIADFVVATAILGHERQRAEPPVTPAVDLADEAARAEPRYSVAFNALTAALATADRFVALSEREHATIAVLAALDALRRSQPGERTADRSAIDRLIVELDSRGITDPRDEITALAAVKAALAHIDRPTTALDEAARGELLEAEFDDTGYTAAQEARADALNAGSRLGITPEGTEAAAEAAAARAVLAIAQLYEAYIRDGNVPDDGPIIDEAWEATNGQRRYSEGYAEAVRRLRDPGWYERWLETTTGEVHFGGAHRDHFARFLVASAPDPDDPWADALGSRVRTGDERCSYCKAKDRDECTPDSAPTGRPVLDGDGAPGDTPTDGNQP